MTRPPARTLLALVLSTSLGCGTLLSGTRQDLSLSTEPAGADVHLYRLDGEHVAGPDDDGDGRLEVPRPKRQVPYLSVVSRDGYCPAYHITKVNMTPGYISEAFLLAIPFIQVIGFAMVSVDDSTGGCCAVEPIVAELKEEGACD